MSFLKFKHHFNTSLEEMRDVIVVGVVFGFVVSLGFNSGTTSDFSRIEWISYLLDMIIFGLVMMAVYVTAQKFIAIALGYNAKFQVWYLGLLLGVLGGFVSQGKAYILIPGAAFLKTIPTIRINKYFSNYTFRDDAWIQFLGLAFMLIFALVLKPFVVYNPEFHTFISMCVALVLFSMLPLPYTPGGKIFFSSKFVYLFGVGYLVMFSVLLMQASFIAALFGGLIGGLMFLIVYHLIHWD
ncbi:MAG: hypothetical protein WC755_03065 [Candidatus Woesearchaeota archaeon]